MLEDDSFPVRRPHVNIHPVNFPASSPTTDHIGVHSTLASRARKAAVHLHVLLAGIIIVHAVGNQPAAAAA